MLNGKKTYINLVGLLVHAVLKWMDIDVESEALSVTIDTLFVIGAGYGRWHKEQRG